MMKHFIPYTLLAACFLLAACQTDDYEPATADNKEMLSLTVSANDFTTLDGVSTRAADNGKATTFEADDRVGLIVLNADGETVIDNVPYRFDGSSWSFDSSNGEGKVQPYYDPSMNTYIVYFPYDANADGKTSVDALKALDAFAHQADQSTEDAYRKSDLMVWTSSGTPMKQITATLVHVRNSFSLDAKVQWTLVTGDVWSYIPSMLEDVIIYDKEGKQLSPYRAEDGSYRYILPDGYDGTLRWHYTYEEKTFGGECTVSSQATGTRYAQVETADMGEYPLDKAAPGDFYCSKEISGVNTGYVLPQEAVSFLDQHRCIGIVFYAGQHESDNSDYTSTGIVQAKCHGYAVALTDVHNDGNDRLQWEYGPGNVYNQGVNTSTNSGDWNGYSNQQKIHEFVESNTDWEMKHFPAALACETYGNRTTDQDGNSTNVYDWQQPLAAPDNTSGWFLPSCGQLKYLYNNDSLLSPKMTEVGNSTPADCNYKPHIKWFSTSWYYWSSSEDSGYLAGSSHVSFSNGYANFNFKYSKDGVRAVLAF